MIGTSRSVWGFDPRSVPGCQLWLDGADPAGTGTLPANGATVSTWVDKSGNGRNGTATGTPSYSTTGINGRPGITFAGSPQSFGGSLTNTSNTLTVFTMFNYTTLFTASDMRIVSLGVSGQTDYSSTAYCVPITTYGTNPNRLATNRNQSTKSDFGTITPGTLFLTSTVYNGIDGRLFVNGTLASYAGPNSSTENFGYSIYAIGSGVSGIDYFRGLIGEVLIYHSAVTTSERQQIEGYLAHKWGLTGYYDSSIPLSIPGCQLWLDAADPAASGVVPSAGTLSTWVDKSGNGRNATTAAGTPTFALTPSRVTFNGSSWYSTTLSSTPTTETIFLVSSTTNNIAGGQGQIGCTTSNFGGRGLFQTSSVMRYTSFGVANRANNVNGFVNGSIFITDVVFEGTNSQVFINGVGGTVDTTTSFSGSGTTLIGSLGGATQPFFGSIYEVIIFNAALTTTQRQTIEGYLARKWGLTSLYPSIPSTHPFSSIRPHLRTFQPIDVPGCALWLDAADQSSMTLSGSNVTQWNDKSGNELTVSAASSQPTYVTNGLNRLGTLAFNGSQGLSAGSVTAGKLLGTTGTSATFCVFSVSDNTAGSCPISWDDNSYTYRFIIIWDSSGIIFDLGDSSAGIANRRIAIPSSSITFANNTYYLISFWQSGGVAVLNVNGGSYTVTTSSGFTGNIPTSTSRTLNIGTYINTSTYNLKGNIAEILIYNTHIPSNFKQVEGYLAHKWGLSLSLPVISPLSIPGCQLWLDGVDPAGNGVQPSNGATVSTWVDKSGNGYNATVAPSRIAGTYSTSFRAVNFATSTTGYITNYSASPTNETMFVVFNNPSSSSYNFILIGGVQGARSLGAGNAAGSYGTSVGNLNTQVAWLASTAAGTYTAGTTVLTTSQFTSSTNTISLNGGTAASGGAPGFTAGRVTYLGVDATDASFYYVGYAMEILFYNSALTTTQRQQIEGYLARKWGISISATLPSPHPFKSFPPASLPFSPRNISGCQLWLDAADQSSITLSGSSVTQWNDKSGNGYNMNTIAGSSSTYWSGTPAYPTIGTSINNLPTVNFKAQSGLKQATTLDGVKNLFWIGRIAAPDGSGSAPNYFLLGHDSVYDWSANAYGDKFLYAPIVPSGINNASASLFTSDANAVTNTAFQNVYLPSAPNVSLLSVSGITGTTRYQGICYDRDIHIGWCGDLAEVLIFSTALTTSQRQQVEGYLAQKWGLTTSLPSTHPYKKLPA